MDISDIISQVQGLSQGQTQLSNQAAEQYFTAGNLANQMADTLTQATDSRGETPLSVQVAETAKMNAQKDSLDYATAVGTNLHDPSNIMVGLGQQFNQTMAQSAVAHTIAAEKAKTVQDKLSVNLFDDPLSYIFNQITVGDDINAANAASDTAKQLDDAGQALGSQINQLNTMTQQTAVTQNSIAQTRTAASIESQVAGTKANIDAQADQAKLNAIALNTKGIETVYQNTTQQQSTLFGIANLLNTEENQAMARERMAMERDRWNWEKAQKDEAKVDDQATSDLINQGAAAYGFTNYGMTPQKLRQVTKLGGPIKDQLSNFYQQGAMYQSNGTTVLGETPANAIIPVIQMKAPLNAGMAPVKSFLTGIAAGVQADPSVPQKLDDQKAAINQRATQSAVNMSKNIKTGDATNIYQAPNLNTLITSQAVASTPFAQKVLKPLTANGQDVPTDPSQMISLAAAAIKSGTISYNDAVNGIDTLFKTAVNSNNQQRQYFSMGLSPQKNYNTKVDSGFGFDTAVDMTDKTQVSNVLSRYQRAGGGVGTATRTSVLGIYN